MRLDKKQLYSAVAVGNAPLDVSCLACWQLLVRKLMVLQRETPGLLHLEWLCSASAAKRPLCFAERSCTACE